MLSPSPGWARSVPSCTLVADTPSQVEPRLRTRTSRATQEGNADVSAGSIRSMHEVLHAQLRNARCGRRWIRLAHVARWLGTPMVVFQFGLESCTVLFKPQCTHPCFTHRSSIRLSTSTAHRGSLGTDLSFTTVKTPWFEVRLHLEGSPPLPNGCNYRFGVHLPYPGEDFSRRDRSTTWTSRPGTIGANP